MTHLIRPVPFLQFLRLEAVESLQGTTAVLINVGMYLRCDVEALHGVMGYPGKKTVA